jgi:glycosyltransferase involved in cell wall biosynthesis
MKNNLTYFIPDLLQNGGIKQFGVSIYDELKSKYDIEVFDWYNDLLFPYKVVLRRIPPIIGGFLISKIFSNHFKRKYKNKVDKLTHFWYIEPATFLLNKYSIVTFLGKEILKKNIKGSRIASYPKVINDALLIHVDSNYAKNLIIKTLDADSNKIRIIPPSIDYKKLSSMPKIEHEKVIIGTLSRFVKRKNIINVIKALHIVKAKYGINFIYYLAGDGIEKDKILKELTNANFEWKYFGEISDEDKIKMFYPSLDVFVMPPLELPDDVEGFGIVYLEANANGIPVVASKTGGIPDAVRKGISGEFAKPTNPEEIALKIVNVLKVKEKYYKSSKNWAKKFDIKIIAPKFERLYIEAYKLIKK